MAVRVLTRRPHGTVAGSSRRVNSNSEQNRLHGTWLRPSTPYWSNVSSTRRPFSTSQHNSVVCLTTGPEPLPKRVLHRRRSSSSSFNLQYLVVPLMSSSSCLRLLPRLPVTSYLQSRVSEGGSYARCGQSS